MKQPENILFQRRIFLVSKCKGKKLVEDNNKKKKTKSFHVQILRNT